MKSSKFSENFKLIKRSPVGFRNQKTFTYVDKSFGIKIMIILLLF